jgi:hypothetical protein
MENQDRREAQAAGALNAGVWKPPRWLKVLTAVVFSAMFVINLLRGYWVAAVFIIATALFFLLRVEAWPKPRRNLAIVVYVALALAMMFEVLWRVRTLLW